MKKILSILLAVLMVAFAVAGCGREKVKDKAWNLTMVNLEKQAEQQMFQAVSEAAAAFSCPESCCKGDTGCVESPSSQSR